MNNNINQLSIAEFMDNSNLTLTTQKRNDLLIMAYESLLDYCQTDIYISDIASMASNEYFIYYKNALDFLNCLDVFDVIGVIMEWEQAVHGQTYCNFSNPVDVANSFIYILIDYVLNDFLNSTDLDYIETENDYIIFKTWIDEKMKEID